MDRTNTFLKAIGVTNRRRASEFDSTTVIRTHGSFEF